MTRGEFSLDLVGGHRYLLPIRPICGNLKVIRTDIHLAEVSLCLRKTASPLIAHTFFSLAHLIISRKTCPRLVNCVCILFTWEGYRCVYVYIYHPFRHICFFDFILQIPCRTRCRKLSCLICSKQI